MKDKHDADQYAKGGKQAYQRKDYSAAARAFQSAAQAFAALGDELGAAEMANNQSVALLQNGEAQAAFDAVAGTEQIFAREGDVLRRAMALGNAAAALEALERLEESLELYNQCADLLKEIGETQVRADVMQSISGLQLRLGRRLQAIATMQAGLDGLEKPSLKQRVARKLLETPFKLMNR